MRDHDFERVELVAGGYVIVCECGWRTHADGSAEVIGEEWDAHRASVASAR